MVVGVGVLVPPAACRKFAEAYEVGAPTSFSKKLAAPLIEHLVHIEFSFAFGCVEYGAVILFRIIAAANGIEQLGCGINFAFAEFALCKRVDYLWKTYFSVVTFELALVTVGIERIFGEMPSRIMVTGTEIAFLVVGPLGRSQVVEKADSVANIDRIVLSCGRETFRFAAFLKRPDAYMRLRLN